MISHYCIWNNQIPVPVRLLCGGSPDFVSGGDKTFHLAIWLCEKGGDHCLFIPQHFTHSLDITVLHIDTSTQLQSFWLLLMPPYLDMGMPLLIWYSSPVPEESHFCLSISFSGTHSISRVFLSQALAAELLHVWHHMVTFSFILYLVLRWAKFHSTPKWPPTGMSCI